MKWSRREEWQALLTDRYLRWCPVPLQVVALIRTSVMWLEFDGLSPQKAVRRSLLSPWLKWALTVKNMWTAGHHLSTLWSRDFFFFSGLWWVKRMSQMGCLTNQTVAVPFQHKHDTLNSLFHAKSRKSAARCHILCKPQLYRLNGKLFKSLLSSPRKGLGSAFFFFFLKSSSKTNTTCSKQFT